jgi:hypothetical protein
LSRIIRTCNSQKAVTYWKATDLNANNQVVASEEARVETNPAGSHRVETTRSNIRYSLPGQAQSYTDAILNDADKITEVLNWSADGFNGAGLATGILEVRRRFAAGSTAPFDVTSTQKKSNLTYDAFGNLIGYHQDASATDNPALKQATEWTGTFDAFGRLSSFVEQSHQKRRPGGNVADFLPCNSQTPDHHTASTTNHRTNPALTQKRYDHSARSATTIATTGAARTC